jgi:hypothetical protein
MHSKRTSARYGANLRSLGLGDSLGGVGIEYGKNGVLPSAHIASSASYGYATSSSSGVSSSAADVGRRRVIKRGPIRKAKKWVLGAHHFTETLIVNKWKKGK